MIVLTACLCILACLMAAGLLSQYALTKKTKRRKCRLWCGQYGWHYLPGGKKRCMCCGWVSADTKGSVSRND